MKQLRRSLDDAEGLSLDTKKEWAFLRTENISLKERDVSASRLAVHRFESNAKRNVQTTPFVERSPHLTRALPFLSLR